MSGPPRPRYGAVRLLAVLWAVAGCGASQPPADASGAEHHRDWLGALVSQAVKSATEPLFAQLSARLDSIDSKLDGLAIRVDSQDHKLDGLATRLNNIDSELDNHSSKLDGLATRLDNRNAEMDNCSSQLDGLVVRLDNQDSKLDGLVTRLSNQDSKLDGLVAGQSSQDSKLDGLDTRLTNQSSALDAKLTQPVRVSTAVANRTLPRDCDDLPAGTPSGVHLLWPGLNISGPGVPAYCDLESDGGGWTVIQRRADVQPRQEFYLGWNEYKRGFGELDAEFWWGLDNMWTMTSVPDRRYELRVDLADFDGAKRHAVYQNFRVSSESDGYRLGKTSYTGDAGDNLSYNVGRKFSTKDRDQDESPWSNCAVSRKSGWWHGYCTDANLNGPNRPCASDKQDCITWYHFKGAHHSLKSVEMKIRPV